MAKRIMSVTSLTPTATADTTNLVDNTYVGVIQGGSSTQRIDILECYLGGLAGASAPTIMILSRDSTVAVTAASGTQTDAAMDASTAALAAPAVVGNGFSGTKPQRSSTLHLWNLSLNAFGGIVRYNAAPGQQVTVITATQPLGEVSLSAFTGGTPGLMGAHVVYEPY